LEGGSKILSTAKYAKLGKFSKKRGKSFGENLFFLAEFYAEAY